MSIARTTVISLVLVVSATAAAEASVLFAVSDSADLLYRIDTDAGAVELVGSLQADASYSGLAWDPTYGQLWISDVVTPTPGYGLGMVDSVTGEVTIIGDHGVVSDADPTPINVMGLAWAAVEGEPLGRLWAADLDRGGLSYVVRSDDEDGSIPNGRAVFVGPWGEQAEVRGLAFAAATGTLYGVGPNHVYTIDVETGEATVVGEHGVDIGQAYIGLAFDPRAGVLYAAGSAGDTLYAVNAATGEAEALFSTGIADVGGLALLPGVGGGGGGGGGGGFDAQVGGPRLFVTESWSDGVWALDPWGHGSSFLGRSEIDLDTTGLVFDWTRRRLYVHGVLDNYPGSRLGTVHLDVGRVEVIGELYSNQFPLSGLALVGATMYGADSLRNALVVVDPATGDTTTVGCFTGAPPCTDGSNPNIRGMAYNELAERLFAISHDTLYRVDTATGAVTAIGGLGETIGDQHIGLAWEADTGRLLAIGEHTRALSVVNQVDGSLTPMATTGMMQPSGLAFGLSGLILRDGFESGDLRWWMLVQ